MIKFLTRIPDPISTHRLLLLPLLLHSVLVLGSTALLVVLLVVLLTLVLEDLLRIVPLRIAQHHIGLLVVLVHIQGFVQVLVHKVVLGRLLANVLAARGHADQMDLVEGEALGTDPGVLLVIGTIMEHLATQSLVRVVAVATLALEVGLLEQ